MDRRKQDGGLLYSYMPHTQTAQILISNFGIMEAENIKRFHLAVVSLGGLLIQDFANKYPHKTASLFCAGAYNINNFGVVLNKENSNKNP